LRDIVKKIPLFGVSITQLEKDLVLEAVETAWQDKANYYNKEFEDKFANYVGREYAIATPSCTTAIHLALLALDVKAGDEVIVPETTWVGSAAPIVQIGAKPVFVDIDPETWCIDTQKLESYITDKTKAIICVNVYGSMPNYDEIERISTKYNISVIEDAAESIGSTFRSKISGSLGDVSVFSFHGSKTLSTGEGGILVTDNKAVYNKAWTQGNHGRVINGDSLYITDIAYKYKMSAVQAALGIAQLKRIEELVGKKIQIFNWYKQHLDNSIFTLNPVNELVSSSYWMPTVIWPKDLNLSIEKVKAYLADNQVQTRAIFYPLSSIPVMRERYGSFEHLNVNAYDIGFRGINLPAPLSLTEEDVQYICDLLSKVVSLIAA
jgi:perosamine synthetase